MSQHPGPPHPATPSPTTPAPAEAARPGRRGFLLGAAALGLAAGPVLSAAPALALPRAVESFDAMPLGAPPRGAQSVGTVTVERAPFGARGNRAVHLVDTSTTEQPRVTFGAATTPARRFTLDLMLEQVTQGVIVAVQGEGADPALGAWRFWIQPAYGKNADGLIQVHDGTSWQRLGVITDLTRRGAVTRLSIEASTTAAVIRTGTWAFRTTQRAHPATAITGIQLASPGTTATGTNVWLDNLAMGTIGAGDPCLAAGLTAHDVITRYTASRARGWTRVATIDAPRARRRDLAAQVHVGRRWSPARLQDAGPSTVAVMAQLADPDIGEHPVTVTVTDRRARTSLSAQGRAQSLAPLPAQTILTEAAPHQVRFPDAVRLADGTFVLAYYDGAKHSGVDGNIRVIRSTDQGATWSTPVTVLATEEDDRDPKLAVLRDGTVLLTTFRTGQAHSPGAPMGTFICRSDDGGSTFGEPVKLGSAQEGAWEHGPALELPSGVVLQPLYGWGARVARSHDGGRTFAAKDEVMALPETDTRSYAEPNLVRLRDGQIVMSIRTTDRVWGQETFMTVVRSHDEGATWSTPEITDLPTSSHHTLLARDGSVILTWGNQWQDGRPTYVTRIAHPERPWKGLRSQPLYNSGWFDQGNPTTVQRKDGSFLTFGYDVVARTLVQVPYRV